MGDGTPAYCLRFAHPAEADWRPVGIVLQLGNFQSFDIASIDADIHRQIEIDIHTYNIT